MEERRFFCSDVTQKSEPPSFRRWSEDRMLISLNYFKVKAVQLNRSMPVSYEQFTHLGKKSFAILLSDIKLPRNANYFKRLFYEALTRMGAPYVEIEKAVQELFAVTAAAISTNSIIVAVSDYTLIAPPDGERDGDAYVPQDVVIPKLIPASESSIQGLEQVTVDGTVIPHTPECPICLEDFGALDESITALPCAHHYHVHCIVQWLEMNHLCPLCRHPMPIEDDHSN